MRKIHPVFKETFSHYPDISDLTQETLWNYLAYGLPPGGFITSVLENDFIMALSRADAFWTTKGLRNLAKWLGQYMPGEAFGSREAIEQWKAKSQQERTDIMVARGLRPSEFDILAGRAVQ